MKLIRTLIIDDEPIGIDVVRALVTELTPDLVIAGTATNGTDAVQAIAALKPDLVFLDVDMPYMNGLEVLQKIPHESVHVIFTTGFEPKKLKFTSDLVCGWLTKPIDPEDFLAVVEKARKKI